MLRSLSIGSYACNDTGRFVEGRDTWSFPDATPNAFGTAAQSAGAGRRVSHYNDAPWQFQQVFSAADRAQLDAFTAALVPGALITLEEDTGTASSRIVSVDSTLAVTTGFTRVLVSGTRSPAWLGTTTPFSLSTSSGGGTVALPTIGGTLAAEMDISVMHTSAGSFSALGIKHAPLAGYDPFDSTGSWGSDIALSTTPATVWAGADIDVAANRGKAILVAALKHTATVASTLKWRAKSTILTASAQGRPTASAVANAEASVNLGVVSIPAAPLAESSGTVYGVEVAGASNTTSGALIHATDAGYEYNQSFAHAGGPQTGFIVKMKNTSGAVGTLYAFLTAADGSGHPTGAALANTTVSVPSGHDGTLRISWSTDIPAGNYVLILTKSWLANDWLYSGGAYAGGVAFTKMSPIYTSIADIYFTAYYRPPINFNAKTPITATCSQAGKTAAFLSCTRIPADIGAVVVQTSFAAGEGWAYDAATRAYYPANSTGVTGTALAPYKEGALEPLPGENTLVLYGNGGAATITGTITERRITRG